jgi:hypothetical protein
LEMTTTRTQIERNSFQMVHQMLLFIAYHFRKTD